MSRAFASCGAGLRVVSCGEADRIGAPKQTIQRARRISRPLLACGILPNGAGHARGVGLQLCQIYSL